MSEANAWLLEFSEGLLAAVGERQMVHLLPSDTALFEVPRSPVYCSRLVIWHEQILPLMDLGLRLLGRPMVNQGLLAVVAFPGSRSTQTSHGALLLNAPPVRLRVNDSQACVLPDSLQIWRQLAVACFEQAEIGLVPVLDLAMVFSHPQEELTGQAASSATSATIVLSDSQPCIGELR